MQGALEMVFKFNVGYVFINFSSCIEGVDIINEKDMKNLKNINTSTIESIIMFIS